MVNNKSFLKKSLVLWLVYVHFKKIHKEICLGHHQKTTTIGRKRRKISVKDTMIYIPITEVIQSVCKHEDTLSEVLQVTLILSLLHVDNVTKKQFG